MAEFGFHKDSRLLNAADYKAVFDNAQYKVSCRHFLILAVSNEDGAKRLGMVIAKKMWQRQSNAIGSSVKFESLFARPVTE